MGTKRRGRDSFDTPVDLAARIGARSEPFASAAPAVRVADTLRPRLDGPLPPRGNEDRSVLSGSAADEPPALVLVAQEEPERRAPIPSPRTPPSLGETDIVATPLPTLDDWHRFELALRRVRGVSQVRPEYYRYGVLKVRVAYEGAGPVGDAVRDGIPGYRVRVIGADRSTLQILVYAEAEARR